PVGGAEIARRAGGHVDPGELTRLLALPADERDAIAFGRPGHPRVAPQAGLELARRAVVGLHHPERAARPGAVHGQPRPVGRPDRLATSPLLVRRRSWLPSARTT